ncbi:hypothetical protein V498_02228, partial [Pseudogymnoascus sp. VKM F-4517 (FW-2822)]
IAQHPPQCNRNATAKPCQSPDHDIHKGKYKVTLNCQIHALQDIATLPWVDPPRRRSAREYRRSTALAYEIQNHTFGLSAMLKRQQAICPTEEVEDSSNVIYVPAKAVQKWYKSGASLERGFWTESGSRRVQKQKMEERLGTGHAWQAESRLCGSRMSPIMIGTSALCAISKENGDEIHTNRVSGKRAEDRHSATMVQLILRATTTQKLQMQLCAKLQFHPLSYPGLRFVLFDMTDELGGHEAVSLVRVILGEGLGRSRGDSRWKVASPVVAGKVGRLGPPDVSQPVLRDVSLRGIDMGHTDGRSLSCRDPVLLVRVKEELRGDRQSRPVEGPLSSWSLCLHELGGDMQHCLLEMPELSSGESHAAASPDCYAEA